ncbi:TPA: ORF6N domain-containing protein [Legionella pneumophila]|uniref:ORF6N domain-containing protein n=1 Tax=Legionella pneumophila TaxID=446 RepID=A0AAN5Q2P7_LEGPN|nr:ORF6N domain-containing protein [Legionella pneumophila]HAT7759703.1 ORF6N domain-containing protein [Legionella pneumophila]HAT8809450.1 ORF6N domain-containing protein [Legionella pneumophila]HAU1430785.1 ORF6N domain-containing protein [Legionella pneumophila]HAU2065598.1 ORF6N domain-containing protein [Legionella pneumophila]
MQITKTTVREKIYHVRNVQVMLDSELAEIYGVDTRSFNQAVKRNLDRFPEVFRFQLTQAEFDNLRSQSVISSLHGGRRYLPYVFTEQGVAMLSAVLKSKTAIEVSIQIMQAFVEMRNFFATHSDLVMKIQQVEQKQILHEAKTQEKFEALFSALEEKPIVPNQGVFYDGQIFDAYVFVSKLIRMAKKSIILLDNYVDETVLDHLSKSAPQVKVYILTKTISKHLKLDLEKYNAQYKKIEVFQFDLSHDRFLIIDESEIYHIGASLKDLAKKWFAFSKLEHSSFGLMERINAIIQNK